MKARRKTDCVPPGTSSKDSRLLSRLSSVELESDESSWAPIPFSPGHSWTSLQIQATWLVCSMLCSLCLSVHLTCHIPNMLCYILCCSHAPAALKRHLSPSTPSRLSWVPMPTTSLESQSGDGGFLSSHSYFHTILSSFKSIIGSYAQIQYPLIVYVMTILALWPLRCAHFYLRSLALDTSSSFWW